MVTAVETPTRRQLAALVGNDQELIILFERLFQQAGTTAPTEAADVEADLAQAQDDIITNANDITFNYAATENNAIDIAANVVGIATNASDIATNLASINVLDTRVTDLEASSKIIQAQNVVLSTYGDTVSVADKQKNLNKFGANITVGDSFETVAKLQGATSNETYVSTNIIDSIVSSDATDTQTMVVEGHTIDVSGNLTFVTQEATLNGQTEVTLGTPLARATRMYLNASGTFDSPQSVPSGTVSVYDNTDGITGGVPNTDAATKVLIDVGETQSEKCATSTSSTDYWFISTFVGGVGASGGSADRVTFRIESRDVSGGGAWRPQGRTIVVKVGENASTEYLDPLLIVPKNHDIRVRAATNSNTAEVFAELRGVLAVVV